jgi:hypothetical protein
MVQDISWVADNHQVAKFCAGLDLRGLSLWSGKPTAGPYPEPAESS